MLLRLFGTPSIPSAPYLYNAGDECVAITGGWNSSPAYRATYTVTFTVTKEASDIKITCKGGSSSTGQTALTHANAIDLTNYTTLHCIGNIQFADDQFGIGVMSNKYTASTSGSIDTWAGYVGRISSASTVDTEITYDVSALNGLYYVYMVCEEKFASLNTTTNAIFKSVWLT